MKIFLADASLFGHARLLNLLEEIKGLEIAGYATDARTTSDAIRAHRPDVVLLDIEMPGRSGLELLKDLKIAMPSIIILVLTNASQPQYRKRCAELGADFFFDKSTEFQKVPEVLKQLIEKLSVKQT